MEFKVSRSGEMEKVLKASPRLFYEADTGKARIRMVSGGESDVVIQVYPKHMSLTEGGRGPHTMTGEAARIGCSLSRTFRKGAPAGTEPEVMFHPDLRAFSVRLGELADRPGKDLFLERTAVDMVDRAVRESSSIPMDSVKFSL